MTQDVGTILMGLHCCSKTNPFCDECPYSEQNCRELESDAAELIRALLSSISEKDSCIDKMQEEIDNKIEQIYGLEERLGIVCE